VVIDKSQARLILFSMAIFDGGKVETLSPLAPRGQMKLPRRVLPRNDFIAFAKEEINQSIPARFRRQASLYGERLAIKSKSGQVTYEDLDRLSGSLARAIMSARGVEAEPVALLLEKDALLIASLLGVLRAGKFYVALDVSVPATRNEDILADSEARLLITDRAHLALAKELSAGRAEILVAEQLTESAAAGPPEPGISPDALAYILYTSGTTGRPKGVVQTHRNVLNNVRNSTNGTRLSFRDRMTMLPSPSVAASVSDIFGALLNGAALFPFDLSQQGFARLKEFLIEERITHYHSVPTVYRGLVPYLTGPESLASLRIIKLVGEPVLAKDVEMYREHFPDSCLLHVSFGATEINIVRQFFIDKQTRLDTAVVPVGYAVEGTEVVLLDAEGQRVAPGETGEIHLKSRYLTPGYWRQPDLSAAAFYRDKDDSDERIYRMGDLGYMLEDGCLVCLGRKDSQVKIRGHRVELADIEMNLLSAGGVKEAAVVKQQDEAGRDKLAAFVVFEKGSEASTLRLHDYLKQRLPKFMLPASIVALGALPLTAVGKIDRRALQSIETPTLEGATSDSPARGELERRLLELFRAVLDLREVGVADDIFELGADSLAVAHLLAAIDSEFGKDISISSLLNAPTAEKLSALLTSDAEIAPHSPAVAIQPRGSRPPFFCVHNIGGSILPFRALAGYIGEDQPFYGIQAFRTDRDPASLKSVEELAGDYLKELRALQPRGPYFLGGHSFGGIVAFEMARQLRIHGEQVGLLALFDTYGPGYPKLLPLGKRLAAHLSRLKLQPARTWPATVLDEIKKRIEKAAWSLTYQYCLRRGRPLPERLQNGTRPAFLYAMARYTPRDYDGKITLFRAEVAREAVLKDELLGWGNIRTAGMEIYDVPGRHQVVVNEPHVRVLAERLRAALDISIKPD
jgi:amino acid adenylation domain-containing protein